MADNGLPPGFSLDQSPPVADSGTPASAAPPAGFQLDDDKFGTLGQQALTGVEGLASGVLSRPVVAGAEEYLSRHGVPGLSAQERMGRQATNPWEFGGTEAAGLVGSSLTGVGEAPILEGIGKVASKATGLGVEGAGTISRIAASGVKTGAEMAALQAADETAKTINQDPNQSIGQAAINIGLSGVIGGVGGATLGAISPLWKASMEKIGVPKIIDDAKAQYSFRQGLQNGGDVPAAITDELNTRLNEVDNLRANVSRLKGDALAKAMPEMNEHIENQVNGTIERLEKSIEKMRADESSYPPRLVNKLEQNLEDFKAKVYQSGDITQPIEAATPDYSEIPGSVLKAKRPLPKRIAQMGEAGAAADAENLARAKQAGFNPYDLTPKQQLANSQEIFDAMQDLKGSLQDYSKGNYGAFAVPSHDEAYDFIHASKDLAREVRLGLEDSKVWADAGDIQRKTNAAIKASIDAEKDAAGKFTQKSALEGGRIVDPTKVNTLVNQSLKGKAGLRGDFIGNYVKYTDDLADTINKIHTDAGLEAPVRLTPTPALDHTLGRSSPGTTLGNWFYDKGLATLAGHAGGEALGAGLGSLVGHPFIGAAAGEKLLSPALTSLAKPLLENASHSDAFKGSLDYTINVIKGGKILNQAAENMFKSGAEVVPSHLLPNAASREKLDRSIEYASNFNNAMKIGGNVGHYLPSHAQAAATASAAAVGYLKSLKPVQQKLGPLNPETPIDKAQEARYQRQLGIAQQPLLAMKYAKEGTLQPQDIKTLQVIYPSLLKKMGSQAFDQLTQAVANGKEIPYHQRQSLSLLLQQPMDAGLTQPALAAVLVSNAPRTPPQGQHAMGKPSHATSASMQKVDHLYATPEQSRASRKLGS